mgnify:CR=1 FL=1
MQIRSVRPVVIGYDDPNDFANRRMTTLVRVETTDGVVGWGEGIAMWPEACKAAVTIIEALGRLLCEAGDITVREAWDRMRAHCWWYGEGGIACFAYSALDMALWDIEGKRQGKPLHALLSNDARASLPAYASSHVNKATIADCVAEVAGFKEQGFQGVKLGFAKKGLSNVGRDPDNDVAFIRALRAAVGDDLALFRTLAEALHELAQFVRIRRLDPAGTAMVNPLNAELARGAVSLELVLARAGIAAGDLPRARAALDRAAERLDTSFDAGNDAVAAQRAELVAIGRMLEAVAPPTLGRTLAELRNLRATRALAAPVAAAAAPPPAEPAAEPTATPETSPSPAAGDGGTP